MSRQTIYFISLVLMSGLLLTGAASAVNLGDPDLIGYWALDEGSGKTTADQSVNGYNGTLNGGVTWTEGVYGSALQFDGSDAYIGTDQSLLNDLGAFTLACWVSGSNTSTYTGIIGQNDMVEFGFTSENGGQLGVWMVGNQWQFVGADYDFPYPSWHHVALTGDPSGVVIYIDGEVAGSDPGAVSSGTSGFPFNIGGYVFNDSTQPQTLLGEIDDVFVFGRALMQEEIQALMAGPKGYPYATSPDPGDGDMHAGTWATLSWRPGDFTVSHDVYMGDNFDDVNNGTGDTFRGNQTDAFLVAGFPGFPFPEGLVPGTTYYWRIDEVNDAEPNSPWKGDVWSFSIPPQTAYYPVPAEGAEFVDLDVQLKWTAGFAAMLHYIVFGEDFDEVSNAATGILNGTTTYTPGPLNLAKTYYWRVDEFDGSATHKGDVWSFTTLGAVTGPNPADGDVDVKPSVILGWNAGAVAASHEVYFGTEVDAVANATTGSPEYKGPKALGEENYDPGKLIMNTTYYWRIDEVNDSPDSPWAGNVWSFKTGDFFVIDDFEGYDAGENQIWYSWHDGLGYGSIGTADYFAGNGTGAAVGDETTPSYTEETIVNGGLQSMPLVFDNNKQDYSKYSEVEYTLTDQRDWTEQSVAELSLWFRGNSASVGSFAEGPVGTYTMTGSGADIWAVDGVEADEFHFAYKVLTGTGSIVARVQSVENTNAWAKAGVMIRETLDPDSAHATMVVTPASGVSFQRRPGTGVTSVDDTTADITAPYWVKVERDLSGNFAAYSSANGSAWQKLGVSESIQMASNVYIGLALTSHDAALTCEAVFTNVTFTGTVSSQWMNQDIGIASNDAEPLYVAVSNAAGEPAVVIHDDPAAAQIDAWTEWVIPLQTFADQGINLADVDSIAIGLGTKGNMTTPGGSGKMYFDDIQLYQPRETAE